MTPLLPIATGVAALVAGWLLLRRLGPRARIGRILAATPVVPVDEAVRLAGSGTRRYVAVGGRLDSDREFLDENERPLVFRRSRLELGAGSRWATVAETRDVVPFVVAGGLATIAVDGAALDEGVIVVIRESVGTAADVADRVPEGTPPATPARLRVEILSSVDHALVLGVPGKDPDLGPILRPGFGRPLIITTMEPAEAMRLLADGHRDAARAAAGLLAAGAVGLAGGLVWALAGLLT